MLVVTAGSGNYDFATTIKHTEKECARRGYDFRTYDLGGLGFGIQPNDPRVDSKFRRVKSAMKPELILNAMYEQPRENIVWIDGDAALISDIHEVFWEENYDVGITVRPPRKNKKTHYINAGVLFFRAGIESRLFVEDWANAMPPMPRLDTEFKPKNYSDQQTLEEQLLLPNIEGPLWDQIGSIHTVHGARVKLLPCATYNNFWCMKAPVQPPNGSKIIHFKGHRTHRLPSYLERFNIE